MFVFWCYKKKGLGISTSMVLAIRQWEKSKLYELVQTEKYAFCCDEKKKPKEVQCDLNQNCAVNMKYGVNKVRMGRSGG